MLDYKLSKRGYITFYTPRRSKATGAKVKDVFYGILLLLIVFGIFQKNSVPAKSDSPIINVKVESPAKELTPEELEDHRVQRLFTFLKSKDSPLAEYSGLIVELADEYDIGWTKVVAISGMESGFGKNIPEGSHNAWGLGDSKFMRFSNWEEGITYMSKLLGNSYQFNVNKSIQAKYCPDSDNCNPDWPHVVTETSKTILSMK